MPSKKEQITLLQFPPGPRYPDSTTVIEVGPAAHACPKGLFVVHMTCKQHKTAKEDLGDVVQCLLREEEIEEKDYIIKADSQSTQTKTSSSQSETQDIGSSLESKPGSGDAHSKPQVLWSMYFNSLDSTKCKLSSNIPQNVHLCCGPDLELDFEFAVQQAKELFTKMFPEEEFLPRAPDPEEIILDDSPSTNAVSTPEPNVFEEKSSENEEKSSAEEHGNQH